MRTCAAAVDVEPELAKLVGEDDLVLPLDLAQLGFREGGRLGVAVVAPVVVAAIAVPQRVELGPERLDPQRLSQV